MTDRTADRTVVLVHGAWHGSWCWERVTPLLDEAGVPWRAVDLPLQALDADTEVVTALLDGVDGPVVLAGHSYGGAVITGAGVHPSVEHLVFIAAFPLAEGESCAHCAVESGAPGTKLGDGFQIDEAGFVTLPHDAAVACLFNDCHPVDADAAFARLRPTAIGCLTAPAAAIAWESKPTTYVVCTHDQGVHPDLQRALAERCGGAVETWDLDHSPFYSDPARLAALLVDRARS